MNYRMITVLCLSSVLITGCASLSTLHTATPVEEGETEINVAPGYYGAGASDGSFSIPNFEIAARHGLSDNLDFGVKGFPIGAAFDLNYAFYNSDNFSASVNPYASIIRVNSGDSSASYGFAFSNLLFDIAKSEGAIFTLGLKPGLVYGTVSESNSNANYSAGDAGLLFGGMAGIKLRLSDEFSLMPSADVVTAPGSRNGFFIYQASLGFMF